MKTFGKLFLVLVLGILALMPKLVVPETHANAVDSDSIKKYVYAALDNRLSGLKKLQLQSQPLFFQQRLSMHGNDFVQAVYMNDDTDTLDSLAGFFDQDEAPVFNKQQLKDFLASDLHTASIWRNRSSDKCIITINTRRMDVLFFGIEHEITHVIQHAEIKCIGESAFIKRLYKKLSIDYPDVVKEIHEKYPDYEQSMQQFDSLTEQEKRVTTQILLEHDADIQACVILKNHDETIQSIQTKLNTPRSKSYVSYSLLQMIMLQSQSR